jgi:indolepyruvate ferredoxin oxidoreductase beta subunit
METLNIVLCGLGGQGILFMTKVLAENAMAMGMPVLGAETHGMAQRGGSVVSHLRLGDAQSSLVPSCKARFLLALDPWEAYRSLPFLAEGGRAFVNAPGSGFPKEDVKAYLERRSMEARCLEAGRIASEMGSPLATNLVLLGFFSSFPDVSPFSFEGLRETVKRVSPERFRATNLRLFDAGFGKG